MNYNSLFTSYSSFTGRRSSILTTQDSIFKTILRLIPALLLGILFLSMVYPSGVGDRTIVMRYFLFGFTGLVAFILPYISFPARKNNLIRLLNLPPSHIFRLYIHHHRTIWGIPAFLILVIAFGGNVEALLVEFANRFMLFIYGLSFLSGIYLYAASVYLKVGPDSQVWNEGRRGLKAKRRFAEFSKYPMDPGSVPSLIASVKISLIGMMGVVLGGAAHQFAGFAGEMMVAIFICLFACLSAWKLTGQADRYFYHTNAFFSEFFGTGPGHKSDREPLQVHQLWWIPLRWRTHSWALMLQLDRRIPAGRLLALGHLFVWVLAYQRPGDKVLLIVWAIFAVFHHALLIFTSNESLAPRWWLRYLDHSFNWSLSRFWVQVRWMLPLALSMMLMKGLFGVFTWYQVGWILLLYMMAGILTAVFTSLNHEQRWSS